MDNALFLGIYGLAVLILLIGLRMPIAYAMILVGGIGAVLTSGPMVVLSQLKTLPYGQFSSYDLSVVPMFILMGNLASRAGLSKDLFRAANAWLGWMRGGVAVSAIAACAGFGAVCGSSLATASTMGQVALPELKRYNYAPSLATGTLAAGGVLGILIPPSVPLVVYAIIVEANIVQLFMAALIPGIIAVIFFIFAIVVYVSIWPETGPKGEAVGRSELVAATLAVAPVAAIFGLVIGGLYGGFFNPTPAAAIGAALVLVYGLARRLLGFKELRSALLATAQLTGMIYLILIGAELLKIFMARGGVPQAAAAWVVDSGLAPMTVMILLIFALLILGCLMDSLSMILLVIPFFWPVIAALDFGMSPDDLKIWFGIIALIVVELGLITPPVGMNVFVINSMAPGVPMSETFKGTIPFFLMEMIRVVLIVSIPALSLWLPSVMR